ncbi:MULTISPECIES: DUF3955 domain-containing protein [Lysobacter]|jgi:hypothetical protein|uniref:DUF3955 domain-containing protein n=1 Tax=Lysobacter TaxID=68 RepID=UPI001F282974|nr:MULTISPECIES: DUF3955 domain-containing protein [Lysobacter]UJB18103.1 DUF3955 domain-containing protein [Lysobacter capsici]UJQ28174.1 DUF3955 domain-containing protein [Lysobacter gummosus]
MNQRRFASLWLHPQPTSAAQPARHRDADVAALRTDLAAIRRPHSQEPAMIRLFSLSTLSLALLALGGGCLLAFGLIGSTIDEQGFLHEPFALLPIGWLLIFAGALLAILAGLRTLLRAPRRQAR